ncbi:family 43 glycosylhydrolase [Nocardioides houyundeii]|uniref:family 43 glycosylhydrolase n=1 Tax=Nocardioides houyundeii TaxID=2045452 RepID=UPI000C790ABD|nr:family 43 glycosylhydrolase [Nocardioides houyundeii]
MTPDPRRDAPARGTRTTLLLLVLAGVLALAGTTTLAALPARAEPGPPTVIGSPKPIVASNFADPAVERLGGGYVGFATGERAPRAWVRSRNGRWQRGGPALSRLPSWSRAGDIWAADVTRVRGWWLLYYSAPVKGLGPYGRCIGVARSRSALRGFTPVGDAPLVCPSYVKTPPAGDPLVPTDATLPRAGVIDPSVHQGSDGLVLLYKTDRIPSSIRLVQLDRTGTGVHPGAVSIELLRHDGVLENPVLVAQPEGWVLLLSEGDYTRCTYRTIWLRSPVLTDWSAPEYGVLLDRATTGLCGPGGADVAGNRIFLHGWTCHRIVRPCSSGFDWSKRTKQRAQRAMYAARLNWVDGLPRIGRWVRP